MGLVIASKECEVILKHNLNKNAQLNLKRTQEVQVKHDVAQVSPADSFALNLEVRVDLKLERNS
ncbi:uncharacterized protein G2W53_003810 [Senna tora]|uniref:Uncharacterized protein n=1 Tax=Senna tora TaxID=362788 RepID=A0A834XBA6_9FABA|nr:uncharacterized protein G2W53_003810 [Senna tora]